MRKLNFQRLTLGIALASASALAACSGAQSIPGTSAANPAAMARPAATNLIKNGCFTGLTLWKTVLGKANGSVKAVSGGYGSCKGAVYAGTSAPPSPDGFYGVSQSVKVPKGGKLTFWYWGASNDEIKYGQQQVNVVDGSTTTSCYKALVTNSSSDWKEGTCNLSKWAGKTVTIEFGAYDNGYDKTYLDWYVSDISLT